MRSKAQVCGLMIAGNAGSNPAGGINVCVVCVSRSGQRGKARKIQTKKQVRIKYKDRIREEKNPAAGVSICLFSSLYVV